MKSRSKIGFYTVLALAAIGLSAGGLYLRNQENKPKKSAASAEQHVHPCTSVLKYSDKIPRITPVDSSYERSWGFIFREHEDLLSNMKIQWKGVVDEGMFLAAVLENTGTGYSLSLYYIPGAFKAGTVPERKIEEHEERDRIVAGIRRCWYKKNPPMKETSIPTRNPAEFRGIEFLDIDCNGDIDRLVSFTENGNLKTAVLRYLRHDDPEYRDDSYVKIEGIFDGRPATSENSRQDFPTIRLRDGRILQWDGSKLDIKR